MRIYGSSPLYKWVELIFRCKRMFIVSVLLGTIITSFLVSTRPTSYDTQVLVALAGDPELATQMNPSTQGSLVVSAAQRKANRLAIWIQRTPEFLQEVVQNAQLDKKYPHKTLDDLVTDVRKHLSEPTLLNDQYMELKFTWPVAAEAEDVMNALYGRFSEKTVNIETLTVSHKRQALEQELQEATKDWDKAAKKRMAYLSKHFYEQPDRLASELGRKDQAETDISQTKLDLAEAEQRLNDIDRQLTSVPKEIVLSKDTVQQTEDPTLALSTQYDHLKAEMNRLRLSYSDQHPKVIDLQKQMDALTQQIEEKKREQKRHATSPSMTQDTRKIALNPEWQQLQHDRREMERTVHALNRRLGTLMEDVTKSEHRVTLMPPAEIEYAEVERDYTLTQKLRDNLAGMLAGVKLDEERARTTQELAVHLEVRPKAEKSETSGKTILLYALGPLLGLVIAFCFSLVAETLDHTLRTPVEVEKYLGKPVLAVIPRMQPSREGRRKLAGSSKPSITS